MALACSYCEKKFTKESTQRRHHYYCRSKQSRPEQPSRRRSCIRCSRDKTRCDGDSPQCSRCKEKDVDCQYKAATVRTVQSRDETHTAETPRQIETAVALSWPNCLDVIRVAVACSPDVSGPSMSPGEFDYGHMNTDIVPLDGWDLESGLFENMDLQYGFADHLFGAGESPSLASSTLAPPMSRSFGFRNTVREEQQPLTSTILQLLRSYPYMLLRKETFPPFISPLLYTWAEEGKGPPLETLINCISLVQMFKIRTATNKRFVWNSIRLEQERIWSEHEKFDKWEILAAAQSIVIYCILRLIDGELDDNDFDFPLLTTLKCVTSVLSERATEAQASDSPGDKTFQWKEWLFNESRRRTVIVSKIMNFFLDLSVAVSCVSMTGFALVPLASSSTLWHADTAEKWKVEFEDTYQERMIYGMSIRGELIRLQQRSTGIDSTVADWEGWHAGMGDMGTLTMIAASLVRTAV